MASDGNGHALSQRAAAEALGTGLLLAGVVGSGIMGERLAGGNIAIALLANSIATGTLLAALILTLGWVSGAHFNPVVSLVSAWSGTLRWRDVPSYAASQLSGAVAGVWIAHLMFAQPAFSFSSHERAGFAQLISEFVATFGLLLTILGCSRAEPRAVPFAVGAYITSAYWFTGSTSFANPAVTIARALTDSFAGIRPADAPAFIVAQALGAAAAALTFTRVVPKPAAEAARIKDEAA